MGLGLGRLGGSYVGVVVLQKRIEELERQGGKGGAKVDPAKVRALAAEKLRDGAPVSRPEAGAFLGVSTRKLQRMEDAGKLSRLPGWAPLVKYAARDVLRLASAK